MDKEQIVEILNKIAKGQNITSNETNEVISSYCKEKGKKFADIQMLLTALYRHIGLIPYYFNVALHYYECKFGICSLLAEDHRTSILIY